RPLELPVRARLLEVDDTVRFQHRSDLDRAPRRVAAVPVDEQRGVVAERAPNQRDEFRGTAGPLVAVVAALTSDPDLERPVAALGLEAHEPLSLIRRRDVPARARRVDGERARPTEELADAAAGPLAA